MAAIALERVSKVYENEVAAVTELELEVEEGEFLVLVGPSGCGKSTLLRMIAGIEEVTDGVIRLGGRDVTHLPPRQRDIAMVFQNYALYPHMSVRRNIGYGLRVRRTPSDEIDRRVNDAARLLGLEELLERKPAALSGGQRQRVAMGRAIVREPLAFLLDEPLSNLDAKLRVSMRAGLARLHNRLGVTTVYVTHDQTEAMTLGDRVAVLRDGHLQQVDTPQAIYREPVNLFVAAFIGSPAMNLIEARVSGSQIHFANLSLPLPSGRRPDVPDDTSVVLGLRPEAFEAASRADPTLPRTTVRPTVIEQLGAETHLVFNLDAPRFTARDIEVAFDNEDDQLLADEAQASFTARVSVQHDARVGQPIELAIDPSELHFFDPATSDRLRLT